MNLPIDGMMNAVSEAIRKGIGRKNLVAIVGIVVLSMMTEAPLNLCFLVAGIAGLAITTQSVLDLYEVRKTGKDQKDNGIIDSEVQYEEATPIAGGDAEESIPLEGPGH